MTRPRTLPLALLGAVLLLAACGPTHAQLARGGGATAPAATASPSPSPPPSPTVEVSTPTAAPATPAPAPAPTLIPTPRPPGAPPAPPPFSAFPLPDAAATALVGGGDGNLWWVDPNSTRVMRTTPRGVTTAFAIPSGSQPRPQLIAAPDGTLWGADFNSKLLHITMAGVVTELDVPAAANPGPYDPAAAADGAVWYVGGTGLFRRDPAGTTTSYPLNGVSPVSLVWGPDHALWFGEAIYPVGSSPHQGIARFDPATSTIQHFPLPGPPDFVGPPIFAADGDLWFGEEAAGKVVRMTPQGAVTEFPTPQANGGRLDVAGLVAARDGTLWASARGAGAPVVLHLTLAGAIHVVTVTGIPGGEPFVSDVAPGPDGHMWMLAGHGYQAQTGGADLVHDNQA